MPDENLILFPGAQDARPAPEETPPGDRPKALLLAADLGQYDAERSLDELAALAEAAGLQVAAEVLQKR